MPETEKKAGMYWLKTCGRRNQVICVLKRLFSNSTEQTTTGGTETESDAPKGDVGKSKISLFIWIFYRDIGQTTMADFPKA